MNTANVRLVSALAIGLSLAGAPSAGGQEAPPRGDGVPLYDDLGDHHYGITTDVPDAQRYFDQGLRLYYAFNHQEAIRSFREAQRLDPDCAMCWWGEGLSWGPNINLPMDSAAAVAAYAATRKATELKDEASPRERDLIDALAERYAPEPLVNRAPLDSAYSRAMAAVTRRYPDDPEAAVLYAESEMNLRPWDYWTEEGEPHEGIPSALAKLEGVMERDPEHPGACHFYIHAVEKLYPERAVECAERLASLMPGAGHLVHMPGHIYIRVGRYMDAIRMNEHAVHADETYIQDQRPGVGIYTAGYYPHNYDFMAFAALMAGRKEQAVEAARKMAAVIPDEMFRLGDLVFAQHYVTRPLQIYVRFGLWDEILDHPAPAEDLPHARAMWRYARGRAFVARGELDVAGEELARLREAAEGPELDGLRLEFNGAQHVLSIAAHVLAGRQAEARGDRDAAVAELREAARLEDELLYGEPPEWTVPVRQELGEVLLAAGQPAEAETAFRNVLERFPANGWSLKGLALALRALGRSGEAGSVEDRFAEAWRHADVEIESTPAFPS
ncbi:MAG: tetratricopeptide repeat protein [Gemmatimonadota bacterium]|nr:tetratricopeptide repeat protein [Gemmatimonadota bacterium]